MNEHTQGPLRLVLVTCDGDDLSDSQALLIDRLGADPRIELAGRVAGAGPQETPGIPLALRAVLSFERLLVRSRILPYDTEPARRLLEGLPRFQPEHGDWQCDLAVALGAGRLPRAGLDRARYGEWAVSYAGASDPTSFAAAPEVRAQPRTEVEITARTAKQPLPVVRRKTGYSPKPGAVLNGAFVAEKTVLFLMHEIRLLAEGRAVAPEATAPMPAPEPPGMSATIAYMADFFRKSVRKLSESLRQRRNRARQFWRIARGEGDIFDFEPANAEDLPARRHLMADPFLFEHKDDVWVFYEATNADGGQGWIEAARLSGAEAGPSEVALKCPYHLSFPCVFSTGDEIYMIPETQESRRLEVWRATGFPSKWTLHATAFEGQYLADSSMFRADDGQWWLLTNLSEHYAFQDHSSELYLFAVDGPDLKSIAPHKDNPVVFGADRARNAGAIIRHQGRLFRPSQNNSFGVYGYGLNLMEILRLDHSGYEERIFRQFTPADKPGSIALHHFSAAGGQYVFDWSGE
ncbi:hypothetical protein Ga0609869_003049 [Rhodovulum iodosum]|uniref:Glucosamine inositolphosphorylceramide transferase 1 N-terminal domain-containing protein n=1 Tax=Rhodovulum iodosum TaxID=68291 RepID=A0ABV3XWG0_9RHOB|nr:hypothetical protein [Rhodovulum robiginosum]RSK38357.1 hypothetical protein EJA01_02100 [Rhodovulum robiginosum]